MITAKGGKAKYKYRIPLSAQQTVEFRANLLDWFANAKRDLPWRRTRDPYAIWISETMLQQTRVTAVIPYYERFLARFPALPHLADAPEQDVLAAWAGLGYYYRARNLQKAAQEIQQTGCFPETYDELRALPGIGDYTAAAVASIAFGRPHAVVDGNVLRVLSRVCGDSTDICSVGGRKHFTRFADSLLDRENPGDYNQAIMELGATVCLPNDPQCLVCPVTRLCKARQTNAQNEFPVKSPKNRTVEERRIVFWIENEGRVLAWQRSANARLMPGFWELPEPEHVEICGRQDRAGSFRHAITFHNYVFEVVRATVPLNAGRCEWLSLDALTELPVSTIFRKAWRIAHRYQERATAGTNAASRV